MNEEIKNKLQRGLALTVKESWDLYKYIQALEQQPSEDMRDATEEERKSTKNYIDSISKPTGLQFDDIYEELDFVQPHKKISAKLRSYEDCISREELINELKLGYFNKDLQEGKNDPCVIDAMIDWAIRTVKQLPPVTPQPKSGKWIDVGATHSQCDKCLAVFEIVSANGEANYCPNCGADMRGDT